MSNNFLERHAVFDKEKPVVLVRVGIGERVIAEAVTKFKLVALW